MPDLAICYFGLIIPQYYFSYNQEFKGVLREMYDAFDFLHSLFGKNSTDFFLVTFGEYRFIHHYFCKHKGNYRERNFAELYVDIDKYIQNHENAFIWRGTAYISDIKNILERFLGKNKTEQALRIFNLKYNIDSKQKPPIQDLLNFQKTFLQEE
jgi:hypothetical protein